MAPKSSSSSSACFLALFLIVTISAAATARSEERLQPEAAAGCWKEIYQIPNCLLSIIRSFLPGGGKGSSIETGVGVPCCKAFLSLTGDCQLEIFQNSSVIPLIEVFCNAVVGGDMPEPEPEPPVTSPAAEELGSTFPWPTARLV
ncbi:unnamed protein product [Linum tenue]|uniref:Prolamin-like domain-containing protein n=1 Tax=Linum tenue TaxID=586396 RepID=A0AAV0I014_9ROSI|nr:unnamed protein product [Linum tenue]